MISCIVPTGIVVTKLSSTKATISWNAVAYSYSYKLHYRVSGTVTWTNKTIYAPAVSKILTGLTPNTTYEYQIETICSSTGTPHSAWTTIQTFSTPLRMEEEDGSVAENEIKIYPNPTGDKLTIDNARLPDGQEQLIMKTIEIKNLLGQTMMVKNISSPSKKMEMDVSSLAQGVYFILLHTDNENVVKKFVKD